jgi:8-oxo-dGTP pyrophosphatase MutT (NUDIX family)
MNRTGAGIVVWRRTKAGTEWLVVRRAHFAPEYAGDWVWGPPGGGCEPGEMPAACARRELFEETGLDAECMPTDCGNDFADVFHAEVSMDAEIRLSAEHDGYRWLPLEEARALCLPSYVGDQLACVAALLEER